MLINASALSLDQRLLYEGWSLNQRLCWASAQSCASDKAGNPDEALKAWRQVVAPDAISNFDKRLAWDDLSLKAAALALRPDPADCPSDPPWWSLLRALRQAAAEGIDHPGLARCCNREPFVHAWRPASAWALQTLQKRCADLHPMLKLSEAAWLDVAAALLKRLCNTAEQALWDQFNQRRTTGQMLLAHLGAHRNGTGEPVHEAYDAFVAEQLSGGYGLLLSEFPVVGRLLAVVTELWLDGSEEMLRRLAASRQELQQHFGIAPEAVLHKVQLNLSDPHRGGRAVAILSFGELHSDDVCRVVYKPKDMQVDQTYQEFLQTLNEASNLPPLRRLTVLSRDGYGFMEWVEHRLCRGDDELAAFYTNAGRTMAVLHILGCTDCHYENLIASDDQLVLVDTETLLEADLRDLISDDGDDPDLLSDLQTSMQGSVLRSGLLPQWQMVGAGKKRAFDISALGIQPPPPERELPGWLGLNSDGMMAGRSSQPCELPTSLPVGLGSAQRLTEFVEELCEGFAQQLEEAIRLRPVLLQALQSFRGKPRRLVARATRLYFTIQRQMLEPGALRSSVAHGLKLEQLSRCFLLASEKPINWSLFQAELLLMERLDIPFFEHLIDGEELPLPEGLSPIPGFIKASGLTEARRRLERLDQPEICFQQHLIRGAIAARNLKTSIGLDERTVPADGQVAAARLTPAKVGVQEPDVYCQEAFKLGEELWSSAIRDRKGRPEWLGMDLGADGESFHFGLIGNSLYSGASGIALLFARLALASADAAAAAEWRQRAWSCFEGLAELAERNRNEQLFRLVRDMPNGICGNGGILLALHLLHQAGIEAAAPLAALLIEQLRAERLSADEGIDVIAGVTGLIGVLLRHGTPQALELARACGDRLLSLQLETGGWSSPAGSTRSRNLALTGFSHGAAGMAAALARLAQATADGRYADAARRAIAYERSVFNAEKGNWPDFRGTSEPKEFMLSWCHGAPGILLSRLVLIANGIADKQTAQELQIASSTTGAALECISAMEGTDHAAHLCCGVLGLTALLRIHADATGDSLHPQVPSSETLLMNQARRSGSYRFFSVDTGSLSLPGLLTGKAGVALALLEAGDGQRWLSPVLSAGLLELG
jgi:type 2 lantibiotic biosynthesis protein LanM